MWMMSPSIFIALFSIVMINAQNTVQNIYSEAEYSRESNTFSCVIKRSFVNETNNEFGIEFNFKKLAFMEADESIRKIYTRAFIENNVVAVKTDVLSQENNIKVLDPRILYTLMKYFKNLSKFWITHANVETVPSHAFFYCKFGNITDINLFRNKITEIHDGTFEKCTSLKLISLEGNKLSEVTAKTFKGPGNLQILNLGQNKIKKLDENSFQDIKSLRWIYLSFNELKELPVGVFKNLGHLLGLSLDYNQISTLTPGTFEDNINLGSLTIASNKLVEFKPAIFAPLTKLVLFQASGNQIRRTNKNSFGVHELLEAIYIEYNGLAEIEPGFFENFPNLKIFDSIGNICFKEVIYNFNKTKANSLLDECFENWKNTKAVNEEA